MYLPEKIENIIKNKSYVIDNIGMSGSKVLIFDDMVLKIRPISNDLDSEHAVLKWANDKIPVPKIICNIKESGTDYLLMSKIDGKMSCDKEYMSDPSMLTTILADAIKTLWNVDISDCPVVNNLDKKLAEAHYRVKHGLVSIDDAEPETYGENGFKEPEDLLNWLCSNRPEEDLALSHGDFCLPNIFIKDNKLSGFIDTDRMGISDRWNDIAICYRSLKSNFSGKYDGKKYSGFDENEFFKAIGLEPNWEKIKYYILLDELF